MLHNKYIRQNLGNAPGKPNLCERTVLTGTRAAASVIFRRYFPGKCKITHKDTVDFQGATAVQLRV